MNKNNLKEVVRNRFLKPDWYSDSAMSIMYLNLCMISKDLSSSSCDIENLEQDIDDLMKININDEIHDVLCEVMDAIYDVKYNKAQQILLEYLDLMAKNEPKAFHRFEGIEKIYAKCGLDENGNEEVEEDEIDEQAKKKKAFETMLREDLETDPNEELYLDRYDYGV